VEGCIALAVWSTAFLWFWRQNAKLRDRRDVQVRGRRPSSFEKLMQLGNGCRNFGIRKSKSTESAPPVEPKSIACAVAERLAATGTFPDSDSAEKGGRAAHSAGPRAVAAAGTSATGAENSLWAARGASLEEG